MDGGNKMRMTVLVALALLVPGMARGDEQTAELLVSLEGPVGFVGMELMELTPPLRQHFGAAADVGVMVAGLQAGGPAARAGVKVADIIIAVDGHPTHDGGEVQRYVRSHRKAERVSLALIRDGKRLDLSATVDERPMTDKDLGGFKFPVMENEIERHMKEMDARLKEVEKELERLGRSGKR
jgi:C-terminal processing protease CtpA/Prc